MNEETTNQQRNENYQTSYTATSVTGNDPSKKKISGASVGAIIGAAILFRLFGLLGGLVCCGIYGAFYAVKNSKLSDTAKVILNLLLSVVFFLFIIAYIIFMTLNYHN